MLNSSCKQTSCLNISLSGNVIVDDASAAELLFLRLVGSL